MGESYSDTTRQSGWIRAFAVAVRQIRPGLGQTFSIAIGASQWPVQLDIEPEKAAKAWADRSTGQIDGEGGA